MQPVIRFISLSIELLSKQTILNGIENEPRRNTLLRIQLTVKYSK